MDNEYDEVHLEKSGHKPGVPRMLRSAQAVRC
jgi:hypothetical protein